MTQALNYIGIDPAVGLECSSCKHISRLPYSDLLNRIMCDVEFLCEGCDRTMMHDWSTVGVVQTIIRERLQQANEDKTYTMRTA